jgi:hypothetical protein
MFQAFLLLVILALAFDGRAQSDIKFVLSKKVSQMNNGDVNILISKGYITKGENVLIGSYMVTEAQKNKTFSGLTIKQMLVGYRTQQQLMNKQTALKYRYGNDSFFIRTPTGDRFFMGMGQLSFEKLVKREALHLPANYTGDYNLKLNTDKNSIKCSQLLANSKYNWIIGNVVLVEKNYGNLKNLRIGDVFEIANRIAASKEFVSFVNMMK